MPTHARTLTLSVADERDREAIYAIRHQVYARELRQHAENGEGRLIDALDACNVYLVAKCGGEVAGFVAITPPSAGSYSVDKYFAREQLPVAFDDSLYEVRLLTVVDAHRRTATAFLLMYGALSYVEASGGRRVIAIGRAEVLGMYKRVGLQTLGLRTRSGQVTYELMSATVSDLRARLASFSRTVSRLSRTAERPLDLASGDAHPGCAHGGAFFSAIGDEFDTLEQRHKTINADVLDAWFDPAPAVLQKLTEHLAFSLRTSPPVHAEGMRRAIARTRGVPVTAILPGAGSSDLIFAGLTRWVTASSRVLILDPMYGEYAHVLEHVIGAQVERLTLSASSGYEVNLRELARRAGQGVDWVVLVNPNSPTGCHIDRNDLKRVLVAAAPTTRFWIDETYVDYVGPDQSLEIEAAASSNVIICKSMSKVYALSGVRAAYLCGPPSMLAGLASVCPPWAVSLPAQIAACEALRSMTYYRSCWEQTRHLRSELRKGLQGLGWDVLQGCANFLLCHLPESGPTAADVEREARKSGLFVRDVQRMGKCFDGRALRVAVKDAATNAAMLQILRTTLATLGRTVSAHALPREQPV